MARSVMAGLIPVIGLGAAGYAAMPATTTVKYRIESKSEQVVDLSGMGQGSQTTALNQTAMITMTLTDTVGGKVMHVVVDSIASDAPVLDPSMDPTKAKGAWLHGIVDAWGRTKIVKTSADSMLAVAQLKNTFARFLPVIKPGAKTGDTWVDTAKVDSKTAINAMKTTTVTTFTHGPAESRNGVAGFRIEAASTTTGAGTMENPMAGTMDVELSSTGKETYFVAQDGRYLGGMSSANAKSTIRVAMSPDPIPVTVTSSVTVSVVK
ncbi:MAG: hypothetical protein AB7S39_01665 [Gemmatimonadales bacterium]